ncbi:hypothetical protein GH733_012907 [Mirounga leonina]|nr:hypothetical protein GH733_012907 [Mirounga leonina]
MLKRRQVAEIGEAKMMGRGVTEVQRERGAHPQGLRISPRESGSTLTSMDMKCYRTSAFRLTSHSLFANHMASYSAKVTGKSVTLSGSSVSSILDSDLPHLFPTFSEQRAAFFPNPGYWPLAGAQDTAMAPPTCSRQSSCTFRPSEWCSFHLDRSSNHAQARHCLWEMQSDSNRRTNTTKPRNVQDSATRRKAKQINVPTATLQKTKFSRVNRGSSGPMIMVVAADMPSTAKNYVNLAEADKVNGRLNSQFKTYAICGAICRAQPCF